MRLISLLCPFILCHLYFTKSSDQSCSHLRGKKLDIGTSKQCGSYSVSFCIKGTVQSGSSLFIHMQTSAIVRQFDGNFRVTTANCLMFENFDMHCKNNQKYTCPLSSKSGQEHFFFGLLKFIWSKIDQLIYINALR